MVVVVSGGRRRRGEVVKPDGYNGMFSLVMTHTHTHTHKRVGKRQRRRLETESGLVASTVVLFQR